MYKKCVREDVCIAKSDVGCFSFNIGQKKNI